MLDTPDVIEPAALPETFVPSKATEIAWVTQGFMLSYRNSVHGTTQAEESKLHSNQAFEELTKLTYPNLFGSTMSRMAGDSDDAQVVLQETYLKAYKGLSGFRGDSQVETWLHEIMFRELSNFYKKEAKHASVKAKLPDKLDEPHDWLDTFPSAQLVDDPHRQAELQELSTALVEEIEQLSPPLGRAVVMFYLRGLPHAEIAKRLGISEGASKVNVHRALRILRASRALKDHASDET